MKYISIPVNSSNISSFNKIPQSLENLNIFKNDEQEKDVIENFCEEFKLNILDKDKFMKFDELLEIQEEAQENGIKLDEKTIEHAINFLSCIFNEIIEIPDISYNELNEVSFTWDTSHSRIYTTIDKDGVINFSNVECSNVNKYSTEQSNIEDFKDLVTRIKNVF